MVKYIVILICTTLFSDLNAAAYFVGSAHTYTSPNALYQAGVVEDGDTILIEGEIYSGNASLAVWHPDQLLIKGVNGTPHLIADGQYIQGKGIWVLAGDNITVENIEFSGATVPDENGAGIRLDGTGVTVRHCFFHDNENGILTSNPYAGDILIEYSEFANNGFGDGYTHNLYVGHVNSLTFRYNYSHHAKVGHNLKSRANENYIYYNRIMDEESGYSSRLIDLSNGGFTIIMGNLLMQGPNAENNTLIGYGKEGLSNDSSHLYVVNNTMVNKRVASCIFVDIQDGAEVAEIHNNIFAGTGTPIKGNSTATGGNVIDPVIANLNFADEANYDYHINSASPAIDLGVVLTSVNGHSRVPDKRYMHPLNFEDRAIDNGLIDAGAYEYYMTTPVHRFPLHQIAVYPNPASDYVIIDQPLTSLLSIELFDISGHRVKTARNSNRLAVDQVSAGIYVLKITLLDGTVSINKLVKT
jgi:hypothetical protein